MLEHHIALAATVFVYRHVIISIISAPGSNMKRANCLTDHLRYAGMSVVTPLQASADRAERGPYLNIRAFPNSVDFAGNIALDWEKFKARLAKRSAKCACS